MSHYLVKFDKKGSAPTDAAQKVMIEVADVTHARDRADEVAECGGGGKAIVQIFNELGLVASRTAAGVWGSGR
jgi:hypothetical protein